MAKLKYKRVLLKISGEALSGAGGFGVSSEHITQIVTQISELHNAGVQVALVCGAGNLMRGATLSEGTSINRATADQMGMLATVMNSLALSDILETMKVPAKVMSAVEMSAVCERFVYKKAIEHLNDGMVVILAGGTGNPFFTTDTCASLRASEVQADVLIKATKVDGVYNADPMKDSTAKMYDRLSFADCIRDNLKVMDQTAISMCRDNNIDIIVCNMTTPGNVMKVVTGEAIGTLVTS